MNNIIWSIGHELLIEDIVKAENCYLYDSKGNKYIDMESGVWCTSVGHCNSRVNKIISKQVKGIYQSGFNYCSPIIESSAKKVLEIANMPGGKCVFLCSGSEAVEFGVRIINSITSKPFRLTFSDSYFGAYGDASNKESKQWVRYDWLNCSCPNRDEGCIGECKEFGGIPFNEIGLFLFEPGSSSGLVRFPSKRLISRITGKIKDAGGYIIVNEVTTGIGRTGKWFGFQHYDLQPDIIAMGKGIGNGYPVSVTAITHKVAEQLNKTNFIYAQSHQNDAVGAAVIKEVIGIISEKRLIPRTLAYSLKVLSSLKAMQKSYRVIKDVRGRGLMIAIELFANAEIIQKELLKQCIIIAKRPNQEVLRLDPPLTIEKENIELFLTSFEHVLKKMNK